jgi:hypothetical protein
MGSRLPAIIVRRLRRESVAQGKTDSAAACGGKEVMMRVENKPRESVLHKLHVDTAVTTLVLTQFIKNEIGKTGFKKRSSAFRRH